MGACGQCGSDTRHHKPPNPRDRYPDSQMALKLGAALGTTPEVWLNAQKAVDLFAARQATLCRPSRSRGIAERISDSSGIAGASHVRESPIMTSPWGIWGWGARRRRAGTRPRRRSLEGGGGGSSRPPLSRPPPRRPIRWGPGGLRADLRASCACAGGTTWAASAPRRPSLR